jgi:hypothetical protein
VGVVMLPLDTSPIYLSITTTTTGASQFGWMGVKTNRREIDWPRRVWVICK